MTRRPGPARPSLPDGFAYANPWFVGAALFATMLGYGAGGSADLRQPYDSGPLPGPDWDRGVRNDPNNYRDREGMDFMRRASREDARLSTNRPCACGRVTCQMCRAHGYR